MIGLITGDARSLDYSARRSYRCRIWGYTGNVLVAPQKFPVIELI